MREQAEPSGGIGGAQGTATTECDDPSLQRTVQMLVHRPQVSG